MSFFFSLSLSLSLRKGGGGGKAVAPSLSSLPLLSLSLSSLSLSLSFLSHLLLTDIREAIEVLLLEIDRNKAGRTRREGPRRRGEEGRKQEVKKVKVSFFSFLSRSLSRSLLSELFFPSPHYQDVERTARQQQLLPVSSPPHPFLSLFLPQQNSTRMAKALLCTSTAPVATR